MSALRAAAVRGAVAETAGAAGAAGRRALLVAFRTGFFAGRLRVEDVCFFFVVWDPVAIGATASAAMRMTAKALSLRCILEVTEGDALQRRHARGNRDTEIIHIIRIAGCGPNFVVLGKEVCIG